VHRKAHLPPCEERRRLRTLYMEAVERHGRAINEVLEVRGKVSDEEYERIRGLANQAKNARDVARLALSRHKQEHGC
jgi:hypothetical protein